MTWPLTFLFPPTSSSPNDIQSKQEPTKQTALPQSANNEQGNVSNLSTLMREFWGSAANRFESLGRGSADRELEAVREAFGVAFGKFQKTRQAVPHADLLLTAAGTALVMMVVGRGFRRFKTATDIPLQFYRQGRPLRGIAVLVNDSDNIRVYHRPWFLSLWHPTDLSRQDIKYETINVRLAGIDAPEMAHFGGACQPYAREAKEWLTNFVQGRPVVIKLHRIDQYSRAVATVYRRRFGIFQQNVGLAMVEAGFATLYESAGAEYGGIKDKLMAAEARAKKARQGMWAQSKESYTSPAMHKKLLRQSAATAAQGRPDKLRL